MMKLPNIADPSMRIAALALAAACAVPVATAAQTPPSTPPRPIEKPQEVSTNMPGHPSPPQPVQQQALEYFLGSWTFEWVGRESPLTMGPRTGTVEFTRLGDSSFASMHTSGTVDAAAPTRSRVSSAGPTLARPWSSRSGWPPASTC